MNKLKINKKLIKRATAFILAGTMCGAVLSGCGNKQIIDLNKSFNVAIKTNEDNVSIAGISGYSDYKGTQVQFVTEDNLRVLTSTHQTELLKVESEEAAYNYASALAGNSEKNINDYNEMQGVSIDTSKDLWNKDLLDLHFTYDKAIILSGDNAIITNISTWTDYEDDDKIQLKLTDGSYVLTNVDKVKLINDDSAKEDSLKNYAISLVGDEKNVIYYDASNVKSNSK